MSLDEKHTIDLLLRKLDDAILAKALDSVKVVMRECIVEAERGRGERGAFRRHATTRVEGPGFDDPFPPLPAALIGKQEAGPPSPGKHLSAQIPSVFPEKLVGATGIELARTDAPVAGIATVLEQSPVAKTTTDNRSLPPAEDHLAIVVRLAAEAGEWGVVATLARQLDALRRERGGGELRLIGAGADAAETGEP